MPKVAMSRRALKECRAAAEDGSPIPINKRAMRRLLEELRPFYEEQLDRVGGSKQWKNDGPRMVHQARCVGVLAWFHSVSAGSRKEVSRKHLWWAFEFVKAGCDVRPEPRASSAGQRQMFTKYCNQGVQVVGPAADYWRERLS
jgi:hypothetical protein